MSAPAATIHLVDSSMYVFRAYFSMAPDYTDVDGDPVHAVAGFLSFVMNLLDEARPTHVAFAFDESLTTSFRNAIYPEYKANRELPPPDLDKQFRYCGELVEALGLSRLSDGQYEADDLIGSLVHALRPQGYRAVIVSGDKDLAQLVGPHDQVWDYARRERYGPDGVHARMGVRPEQIADFLALTGDSVDNIPGVPGIGAKTAAALLAHFDTLDALYARLDEVEFLRGIRGAKATAQRLREHRELAALSRRLTGIALDAPVATAADAHAPRAPDAARLEGLMDRLRTGPLTRRRVADWCARRA
jgi:5'-3' exonuclease